MTFTNGVTNGSERAVAPAAPTPTGDAQPPLELWLGVEGTLNRVGDHFFDQLQRSGHEVRLDDLDLIAALGVRKVRYPFVWERAGATIEGTAEQGGGFDWTWSDQRMERLHHRGITPIAGLLHHGSGPMFTSLVDERFPQLFAQYAAAFAARYPGVIDYTPVNEPLTTARFSGLYGVWYPHGRDDPTFLRCLVNQCRATVLAMRAIREVQPHARLVQTEDHGEVTCSPGLEYQRDHQNELRWLSFDLLCGRVTPKHPLYRYVTANGVQTDELAWFMDNLCTPDVFGLNHYVTSDRRLDSDLTAHPLEFHGSNGRHRYADVPTWSVAPGAGHQTMLRRAWQRYGGTCQDKGSALAMTEVHLGGARVEQLRWVRDAWEGACAARADGARVEALTLWAAFGSFDWNCLVTEDRGFYEPGLFDVRTSPPRPTALAQLAKTLAAPEKPKAPWAGAHPAIEGGGWWQRRHEGGSTEPPRAHSAQRSFARPIVITGGNGTLGHAFAQLCDERGLRPVLTTRAELDITSPEDVSRVLEELRPWAVVNAAGFVRVDDAEKMPDACYRANTEGAAVLAEACARRGVRLLTFSSDLVFDGSADVPYQEHDTPQPLNVYGKSKAMAEERVREALPDALIVRTSAFFGPWDEANFVTSTLTALSRGERVRAPAELTISPTYVPSLVATCLDLCVDDAGGTWHLANQGAVTWHGLACMAADLAGFDASAIEICEPSAIGWVAPRPHYSALGSVHSLMPSLEASLDMYMHETKLTRGRR